MQSLEKRSRIITKSIANAQLILHSIGLSAGARTVFRIVTALAPPFVMESELDEDGLCLRGLPCHRVSPVGMYINCTFHVVSQFSKRPFVIPISKCIHECCFNFICNIITRTTQFNIDVQCNRNSGSIRRRCR